MLALGVPNRYAQERLGHATDNMLKTVYQHTITAEQERVSEEIDSFFDSKLHTILHTEKQES